MLFYNRCRVSNALELREHLNKQAKNLSAGLKRKVRAALNAQTPRYAVNVFSVCLNWECLYAVLSFALLWVWSGILRSSCWTSRRQEWIPSLSSGCGETLGVTEEELYRLWEPGETRSLSFCRRAMRAAFRNHQRGAILTTHYMEEAEAVCDRVAIMVSGQLRFFPPWKSFFFFFFLLNKSDLYGITSPCSLTVSLPSDASAPSSTWRRNTDKATVWRWNWERSWRDSSRWRCCTRRSSESFLTPSDRRGVLTGLAAESRKIKDSLYCFCLFSLIVL